VLTERVPGFAICAHCGARRSLRACSACGLLVCPECRAPDRCVVCHCERVERERRARRRAALETAGRRAGVVACVAFSGLAAVGAALLPDAPPTSFAGEPHLRLVAHGQVRFVADAVQHWSETRGGGCPDSLRELRAEGFLISPPVDPWGEPLLLGCIAEPHAWVVMSKGPDRLAGTADDITYARP
jgi:hypothetical protein